MACIDCGATTINRSGRCLPCRQAQQRAKRRDRYQSGANARARGPVEGSIDWALVLESEAARRREASELAARNRDAALARLEFHGALAWGEPRP